MIRGMSALILLIVLCSALVLFTEICVVFAGETVYIRADGSVEGTDKIQRDGNVYTLTGDISDPLVVERDNIVVDGAGHVLEGAGAGRGISLTGRSNITIKNITIREFDFGIDLWNSSGNTISANAIANTSTGIYLVSRSDSNSVSANNIANNQWGISLTGASNNSISANNMANNDVGISLAGGSNNSISVNNITNNNVYGIYISFSLNNNISANNIANNTWGIYIYASSNNTICHNNLVGNTVQAQVMPLEYVNVWDAGYPSGGNYWSDYSGVDLNSGPYQNETGSDGIGDTNYTISTGNNDRYPLMGPISTFYCGSWDNKPYYADIVSNSTISAFNFNATQKLISFKVNGSSGTIGFCKITIDNSLLADPYSVLVDGAPVSPSIMSNGTHSSLYFTYAHSNPSVTLKPRADDSSVCDFSYCSLCEKEKAFSIMAYVTVFVLILFHYA